MVFYLLVTPAGVEPAIFWMRTRRPGPLDEGAVSIIYQVRTQGGLGPQNNYITTEIKIQHFRSLVLPRRMFGPVLI